MLTSLYISKPQYNSKITALFSRLIPDSVHVELREADGVKLKCVVYTNRGCKVNFDKIDKIVGAQRNRLLCSGDTPLPKEKGYRRFLSSQFRQRLCTNLGISLLSGLENTKLKVGLIDEDASFTPLVKYLLKYTDNLVVASNQGEVYSEVSKNLLNEIGAPIRLTRSVNSLYDCDLVIAPNRVPVGVSFKDSAVLLTTEKPSGYICSTVIYDYGVELSEKLLKIKPEGISDTYFASALYTLAHMYKLGAKVPSLCISENKVHTLSSLKFLIQNKDDKT